jgi:glyoxylase-like metal-dependent hydrolase (beta-lactamase superfamily II)
MNKEAAMTASMTRRQALTSLAAGASVSLIPVSGAKAKAPASGEPAASALRYKVGDFEVTAVYDGYYPLAAAGLVTNQPLAAVERALADINLPPVTVPTPLTPLIVNTGRNLVVIDPGNGDILPGVGGRAVKNMRAAGIDPQDVDTILITHFHVDHLSAIRLQNGIYQFPNARILVPQGEWDYWMNDGNQSRAPQRQQIYFNNSRRIFLPILERVERFAADSELVAGIRSVATPGHTPGHSSFMISSAGHDLLVWGDVTNHTDILLRFPLWTPSSDMDQQLALKTRLRLMDMAITDRLRVSCFHAPFPANGYIRKISDEEYRLVPVQWTEDLDGW